MSRTKHEPPVRFIGQIMESALEGAAELDRSSIEEHIETLHLPPKRTDPVQAIPFADERIPDAELSKMIELMETEEIDLQEAASRFHRAWHLVERSMADYQPEWRRFLTRRILGN